MTDIPDSDGPCHLFKLADELLENILLETRDPYEMVSFGQTCKRMYGLSTEEVLFKRLYRLTWDHTAVTSLETRDVCQSRARAFHDIAKYASYDSDGFPAIRKSALAALVNIAETTCPDAKDKSISTMRLQALFIMQADKLSHWLGLHLHSPWQVKPLFERLRSHSSASAVPSPELIDRNKLIVYAGITPYTKDIRLALRGPAREMVYRKAQVENPNPPGPFMKNSDKVDWRLLGSIAIVMYLNVEDAMTERDLGDDLLPYPDGFTQTLPTPPRPYDNLDWAGVCTDSFVGNYSFVDFRIYELYNSFQEEDQPHLMDVSEATGDSLTMSLQITNREEMLQSQEKYPTIRFKGHSGIARSRRTMRTELEGEVSMSSEGYFLWKWTVEYDGEKRWLLNGVQVSKNGILGLWSDFLDPNEGPTGPWCYWDSAILNQ